MITKDIDFSPAWPHGDLRQIFTDVYFVTGTNKIHYEGANIQTSRNMVIVRHGSALTLINTVRLNEDGLQKLDALGTVGNIVRIGAFHGRDDGFYKHRYPNAILWTLKGVSYANGLMADKELIPGKQMPFPDCSLFSFESSSQPECVLHFDREGGILVTCDSIQNITATDEFYNSETAKSFHDQGLIKPANISPIWLGATNAKVADFDRLLKSFSFHHLLTAHGVPLLEKAFEQVTQTVRRVFG
jgi:hypothetical protein